MHRLRPANRAVGALVLLATGCLTVSCATNPATGRTQLMLISEQQEIELGRQEDPKAVAAYGLYDDASLQAYVEEIGLQMARRSERPNLPWSIKVLDDPSVNAMALPGGFVYVTRGILGYFNSEAELATVLGHEIGHVTARHSANQLSKAQLASVGLGVGMMVEPGLQRFGNLAQLGTQLLFLKFSRDDERQADDLGVRYMLDSGYDPQRSPEVFDMLKRIGDRSASGRVPAWMSTHPEPENRTERIRETLASLDRPLDGLKVGDKIYLRQLNGLTWGPNPREGYFEEQAFLHPELEFRLVFPAGWQTQNTKQAVIGLSSQKDALVQLSLASETDLKAAASEFTEKSGATVERFRRERINDLESLLSTFEYTSPEKSSLSGQVALVAYRERVFQLLGVTPVSKWEDYSEAIDAWIRSFERLRDPVALSMQPARLQIVELERPMTLDEVQRLYPSSVSLDTLALINDGLPESRFERGDLIKRVVGGPTDER